MATCKDCVHYDVCHYHIDEETDMTITECGRFINKADFVEVVRCKDCKHKGNCAMQMAPPTRDYVLEQNISTYNKVDFCSYGERK